MRRQAETAMREAATVEAHGRSLGARVGHFLAGLVGWRAVLEARYQSRLARAQNEADQRVALVSAATEGAVAKLEREFRRAAEDAAKARREVEEARREVARQRRLVQQAARERDIARSAFAEAAHERDVLLQRGGLGHGR